MALGAAANATESSASSLQTGVNMILSQLRNTLIEAGLEEIDATGKTFDPNIHEAVSQRESAEVPEGQVVQQLRRGYKLRDRLRWLCPRSQSPPPLNLPILDSPG